MVRPFSRPVHGLAPSVGVGFPSGRPGTSVEVTVCTGPTTAPLHRVFCPWRFLQSTWGCGAPPRNPVWYFSTPRGAPHLLSLEEGNPDNSLPAGPTRVSPPLWAFPRVSDATDVVGTGVRAAGVG